MRIGASTPTTLRGRPIRTTPGTPTPDRSPRHARLVCYVDGSAEAIPLDDASATVVWSIATVHHWQDIDAGLAETRRVLGPGGRFLAGERHSEPGAQGPRSHGWTPEQAETFAEACRAHGFVDVRVEEHQTDRHAVLAVLATAPPA